MHLPVSTEIAPSGTTPDLVAQEIIFVMKDQKIQVLGELLVQYTGSVLLFVRTKRGASKVARNLRRMGHTAAEIHADRSLDQRKKALSGFKTGRFRILVATDVAARGLDVKDIELVVNYDLPDDVENYVHRIGRTGRAGKVGHAIAFATPQQIIDVKAIERFMSMVIPVSPRSKVPAWMIGRESKKEPTKPAFGRQPKKAPGRFGPRSRRR
jgi:ATP-dependent RNA helicase RhlE